MIPADKTGSTNLIYTIRGKQLMLDKDLAALYQVEAEVFNQAVKRNSNRFPERFRFLLTEKEYKNLRSQIATSSEDNIHSGRRYIPYAFTEQGIAMPSAVLKSDMSKAEDGKTVQDLIRKVSRDMAYQK